LRRIADVRRAPHTDDSTVSEWEQELAKIDFEALSRDARTLIASIVETFCREDVELAELQHAPQPAAA